MGEKIPPKSQPDKFKQAAREHETDNREKAFDQALRKVAKDQARQAAKVNKTGKSQ